MSPYFIIVQAVKIYVNMENETGVLHKNNHKKSTLNLDLSRFFDVSKRIH